MNCDSAFRFYSYLVVLVSFLTLLLVGGLSPVSSVGYLMGLALSWRYQPRFLAGRGQTLAVILLVLWFLLESFYLTDFLEGLLHLLLLISLLKLFSLRTGRDYLILYLISFVFILLGSSYTISVLFLAGLVCYVFLSILAFMLHETRKSYAENPDVVFVHGAYLKVALLVTLLIGLLTAPLFLVIPRAPLGFLASDRSRSFGLTGFSDRVNLGEMGRIMSDSRIVMRVKLDATVASIPGELKWRGVALDYFDGKMWLNTRRRQQRIFEDEHYGGYLVAQNRRQDESLLRQTFFVEPFSNLVFAAPDIVMVSRAGGRRGFVLQDGNDSFSFLPAMSERIIYTVYSDVGTRSQRILRTQQGPKPVAAGEEQQFSDAEYLQLPALPPEVRELALRITVGCRTPIERSLAIERYLRSNYRYDLENRSAHTADPLYDFLFYGRSGHCEYFATAQAVLMRSLGIPCRVVNGFRQGEYNDWSGYFIVRQSHAHSWVEGQFGPAGWIEFDSTPGGRTTDTFFLAQIGSEWLDALDTFWTEVISYDRIRQISLFHSAATWLVERWQSRGGVTGRVAALKTVLQSWFGEFANSVSWRHLWLLLLLPAGWLLYRQRRYLRLFVRHKVLKKPQHEAPEYYLEMLDILKKKGQVKQQGETPLEFATRLQPLALADLALDLTRVYYRSRFGNVVLGTGDLVHVYQSLRLMRRMK